jgi:glycosyltransferase involved in cell wall biosynthesis
MRICMFSRITPDHRVYAPPVHGMIGKVFRDLGHDVTILTTALPDGWTGVRELDYAQVHYLPGTTAGKLGPDFWRVSAQTFDAMHAERPFDLVFGRGEATWGFHQMSSAAGKPPVIAHEGTYPLWLHQLQRRFPKQADMMTAPIALMRLPFKRVYRACLQKAHVTVCNSAALAVALPRSYWWSPPNTTFIPYGMDLTPWDASPAHPAASQAPLPPKVIFVGRLTSDKGVYDMVEVMSRLRHPTACLEMIGPIDKKVAHRLQALISERGLTERILVSGPERNENLPQRLRGAAAYIFPSTHPEGLSKSVMEAMAASLPVLAYRIPGMDALVVDNKTGWLVPPGDVGTMAVKLDKLLSSPDLAMRMGKTGRLRLQEDFTTQAATKRWSDLLTELVRPQPFRSHN